jgi:translation initiation factor 1
MSGSVVWSSEHGRMCPACRRALKECVCRASGGGPRGKAADAVVRVGRQTKGRRGKGVTVVTDVPLPSADLTKLAKALKKRCGSGGTVKDGVIEIQGDHRDAIVAELEKQGFRTKRAGG